MASQQQERPITYSDVFGAQGLVGDQPITKEDAALMQRLESMALGHTQKDGAASAMQSAADQNVAAGVVPHDAHTFVAEQGLRIEAHEAEPGTLAQTEYVVGLPVASIMSQVIEAPYPPAIDTDILEPPFALNALDATDLAHTSGTLTSVEVVDSSVTIIAPIIEDTRREPVTIGEAMEAAALGAGDSALEESDVQAIQTAECQATGQNLEKGGIGATAQSVVAGSTATAHVTLADVLMDASADLRTDKIVTKEDAAKVTEAELRARPSGDVKLGGVADCMQAAAEANKDI